MRVDFSKAIASVLGSDEKALLVTGDLGFNAFEDVVKSHPERFLNAGVAEQNMVGLSAGMALMGYRPWVYSIVPFVIYRCLEQIRNDVCLHDLPVRFVGNGGGYTYGIMGSTHHALEDLGVLKVLPNISLFFPCGNDHVAAAAAKMNALKGPSYLRLAISGFASQMAPLSEDPETLTRRYKKGSALTIIGVGHATQILMTAIEKAGLASVDADVFGIARYPFDLDSDRDVAESASRTGRVLVVEEHYQPGGMGESLRMALPPVRSFEIMAAKYAKDQLYGSTAYHLKQSGLTPDDVVRRATQMIRSPNS